MRWKGEYVFMPLALLAHFFLSYRWNNHNNLEDIDQNLNAHTEATNPDYSMQDDPDEPSEVKSH